jgi:hypothetical protein
MAWRDADSFIAHNVKKAYAKITDIDNTGPLDIIAFYVGKYYTTITELMYKSHIPLLMDKMSYNISTEELQHICKNVLNNTKNEKYELDKVCFSKGQTIEREKYFYVLFIFASKLKFVFLRNKFTIKTKLNIMGKELFNKILIDEFKLKCFKENIDGENMTIVIKW